MIINLILSDVFSHGSPNELKNQQRIQRSWVRRAWWSCECGDHCDHSTRWNFWTKGVGGGKSSPEIRRVFFCQFYRKILGMDQMLGNENFRINCWLTKRQKNWKYRIYIYIQYIYFLVVILGKIWDVHCFFSVEFCCEWNFILPFWHPTKPLDSFTIEASERDGLVVAFSIAWSMDLHFIQDASESQNKLLLDDCFDYVPTLIQAPEFGTCLHSNYACWQMCKVWWIVPDLHRLGYLKPSIEISTIPTG